MAQPFTAHSHNRGTLSPGQTISVNNYTIQVEKYLNQGGFAHVYVVRSATPINNTTQHVLKRIAVSDEAMLVEVKKEVDIMRLLRGHPNIVNFIDASSYALSNGTYEVFILMEFCNGGGIIDMMNRRLRERLTEAEILQIFVDVCEAVAAMHNLKPALLHRDLKVENILQSSLTRYKLCDFGSSTPVRPRPPSSMHEIRLLEADLNQHTTLQYRAPEMVDVYLRRPVDEKSDVWALGVLLYKLCYYTTPFEEHGPLAILNVQYKIPPYPVYSPQINSLIASMLRELGTQRPSVFEVLSLVHRMRGSKSPYQYNIPPPQSLRQSLQESSSSGMESLVSFRTSPTPNAISAAAQARQPALDVIAPMRRGRPITSTTSSSPISLELEKDLEVRKFEEKWNSGHAVNFNKATNDVWNVNIDKAKKTNAMTGLNGFGDSFVDLSVGKSALFLAPPTSSVVSKVPSYGLGAQKDAFDGLGSISRPRSPSPTLAEATNRAKSKFSGSLLPPRINGISRTPVPTSTPTSTPLSPRIPSYRTGLATYHRPPALSAEERYPSLDELDKGWRSRTTSQIHSAPSAQGEWISSSTHLTESSERSPRPAARASPDSPIIDKSDKPRPQSMFMFPPKPSLDSTSNLRAPDMPRKRVSPRRGSISDMVDLYESMGSGLRSKDPPAHPSKPVGLKLSKTSPITSRFPAISPSGVSFPVGQVTSLLTEQTKTKPKPRRSPTTSSSGDYNPQGSPVVDKTKPKGNVISRVPRQQSVSPDKYTPEPFKVIPFGAPSKPFKPASLSMPKTVDLTPCGPRTPGSPDKQTPEPFKAIPTFVAPSKPFKPASLSTPKTSDPTPSGPRTPVMESPISSPSPERPYQGVGKLIDQWQRKTEEAEASRRSGPRAPGRPIGPRVHGRREDGNGDKNLIA